MVALLFSQNVSRDGIVPYLRLIGNEYGRATSTLRKTIMAFGRDGSELELQIFDLQNKKLTRALEDIIERSGETDIVRIAKEALDEAEGIRKKLGDD